MSGSLSGCSLVIYSSISVLDCCSLLTSVHKIVVITLSEILHFGEEDKLQWQHTALSENLIPPERIGHPMLNV